MLDTMTKVLMLALLCWALGYVWWCHRNAMMNAVLFWLSGWLRCRLILDSGKERNHEPYLERYFIGRVFGRHVYLHRFLASDSAQLHDHPWRWALSLIVCGAYLEDRRWGRGLVRWYNWLTGESFHRVELIHDVYTWTIFMTGPRCKTWGMMEPVLPVVGGSTWPDSQVYRTASEYEVRLPTCVEAFVWTRYEYGAKDKNEDAFALKWYETYPRGRHQKRERRDYVRSK